MMSAFTQISFVIVLILSVSFHSKAQYNPIYGCLLSPTDTTTNDTIYSFATEMPQYPGGDHALQVFFLNKILWPDVLDNGDAIPSTFYLSWVVEKDGSVSDPEVKSPSASPMSKELEQAIIKAITKLSVFKPAKINGEPVRFRFRIPLRICLRR